MLRLVAFRPQGAWSLLILVGPLPTLTSVTATNRAIGRRTLLAAGVLTPIGLLAACSAGTSGPTDPDDTVRNDSALSEAELIAQYDAAILAFPALKGPLTGIRDQHAEHLSAFGPPGTGSASPSTSAAPASAKAAVTALADAERTAAKQRLDACAAANEQQLIWTLSLVGASEAQHAIALAAVKA